MVLILTRGLHVSCVFLRPLCTWPHTWTCQVWWRAWLGKGPAWSCRTSMGTQLSTWPASMGRLTAPQRWPETFPLASWLRFLKSRTGEVRVALHKTMHHEFVWVFWVLFIFLHNLSKCVGVYFSEIKLLKLCNSDFFYGRLVLLSQDLTNIPRTTNIKIYEM